MRPLYPPAKKRMTLPLSPPSQDARTPTRGPTPLSLSAPAATMGAFAACHLHRLRRRLCAARRELRARPGPANGTADGDRRGARRLCGDDAVDAGAWRVAGSLGRGVHGSEIAGSRLSDLSGKSSSRAPILIDLWEAPGWLMSELGLVSRASPVQMAVCNCTRDEGRSFEAGSQVQASNRCKLLSSKAMVVSVVVNVGTISRRVRLREASASEPPMKCRKRIRRCRNRGVPLPPGSARENPEACPRQHPACRRRDAQPGSCTERENLSLRC
jgi:hypothetical protein